MAPKLRVEESSSLLAFLRDRLGGWSRKRLKKLLAAGGVMVNGQSVTAHDYAVVAGDHVEILGEGDAPPPQPHGPLTGGRVRRLAILHQDGDMVAIDKPAGLPSVALPTAPELSVATGSQPTLEAATASDRMALAVTALAPRACAQSMLEAQLSTPDQPVELWPVYHLDAETSGVLLFTTSPELQESLAALWSEALPTFLAIVEGQPEPRFGTIAQPLRVDSNGQRAHVGSHAEADPAVTHFETEYQARERSLLRLRIDTPHHHQIRAHLAWLGHPVAGDALYGSADQRLGLHAMRLVLPRRSSGEVSTFESRPPMTFRELLR